MGLQHEIGKKRPFELAEQEAFLNLARTAGKLDCQFARLFREKKLSPGTYNILRILRGAGEGLSCQAIAGRLVAEVPDMTRLIDRLEHPDLGYVRRERSTADRRKVLIHLTDAGAAVLRKLDAPVRDLHKRQLGHMSAAELAELNRLLVLARQGAE